MNFKIWTPIGDFSAQQIFLIAVLARLVAACVLNIYLQDYAHRTYLIEGDAEGYWILAEKIRSGEEYSLYTPARYVLRMPGFPAVLAVSQELFGETQNTARYFLAVLTSLAVFPAYWLAEQLHSRRAGQIAGLLVALTPVYIGFSVTILTECLFGTAILWNLWACARWIETLRKPMLTDSERSTRTTVSHSLLQSLVWACLAGVFTAIAVYFRPSWLLFPFCLLPVLMCIQNQFWLRTCLGAGLLGICLFLSLLPWGLRNQQQTGHFVITTLWMGPSLYDGLGRPGADGDSDMRFFDDDRVLDHMSEYEMNQHYKNLAVDFAKTHPGETVRLMLVKFWRFWKPWPNADQFQHPVLLLVIAIFFLNLIVWSIWGIYALRDRPEFIFLYTMPIVYFTALHLLFVSSLRYRLPAEYPLTILAGVGLAYWLSRNCCPTKTENREDR